MIFSFAKDNHNLTRNLNIRCTVVKKDNSEVELGHRVLDFKRFCDRMVFRKNFE